MESSRVVLAGGAALAAWRADGAAGVSLCGNAVNPRPG
jgi:hypothetical protein